MGLGANKKPEYDEGGYRWVTLTDPEGAQRRTPSATAMPTSATGALGTPGQDRESAGEHDTSGGDDAW